MENLIDEFCSITGAERDVGQKMLEVCSGNLALAIEMHMDEGSSGLEPAASCSSQSESTASSSSTNQDGFLDDVRAPIPQKKEILVEDVPVFGFRGRKRKSRSVFDGFRDFQAEAKQQEEMLLGKANKTKKRSLEDLFRPPIDITYKGTFSNAKEAGMSQHRWLMVNVQNVQEFACQALNRDVWSNSAVKAIIKEHFIFWQVYYDSEEGRKFTQFYKVHDWPYVAILDPQTGENLVNWNNLDSASFCDLVIEFLSQHPLIDTGVSAPTKEKKRTNNLQEDSSILDASENDQLNIAIHASLHETTDSSGNKNRAVSVESDSDSCSELETFSDSDSEQGDLQRVTQKDSVVAVCKDNSSGAASESDLHKLSSSITAGYSMEGDNRIVEKYDHSVEENRKDITQGSSKDIRKTVKGSELLNAESSNVEFSSPDKSSNTENQIVTRDYRTYFGKDGDPKNNILFRFPDGRREQLVLPASSRLMALVLFVESLGGYPSESFEMVTQFPQRNLSKLDLDATLQEVGLHQQESIFIQSR
ncbi:hypothetical protein CHS0354_002473 [Potamilus streckersoni]|uniref:UBX domain-containing protein n=1 Tax=Potamilus streckersoni TaxID=2493646 RepID=A0AAE0W8Y4_9BIVA|nr:hypothetical protein CHS0354_002473 [Potamilus streckersoni]